MLVQNLQVFIRKLKLKLKISFQNKQPPKANIQINRRRSHSLTDLERFCKDKRLNITNNKMCHFDRHQPQLPESCEKFRSYFHKMLVSGYAHFCNQPFFSFNFNFYPLSLYIPVQFSIELNRL